METPQHYTHNSGFTLIELSIVLVIVALLAGGVLVGRDMLFAAKQRAVFSEKEQLVAAVQTFRLKYGGLPGDFPNATSFWGEQPDCGQVNTTPREETCNGDGNGKVGLIDTTSGGYTSPHETFWFWQQLANAGLWAGKYSGATSSDNNGWRRPLLGVNVPASKAGGKMVLHLEHTEAPITQNWWFAGQYGNVLQVGEVYPYPNGAMSFAYPWMTGQQMFAFDQKLDDGKPGTGNIRANPLVGRYNDPDFWSPCFTDPAAYWVELSGVNCNVLFPNLF